MSRRSLLGAAGVGAAGLAAGALGGLASAPASGKAPRSASAAGTGTHDGERPDGGEQVVVHVRSGRGGDLDVFSGTSHTRVHDAALAARLRRMIR